MSKENINLLKSIEKSFSINIRVRILGLKHALRCGIARWMIEFINYIIANC
jgi:hypothetical protein